jgi:hypothetical protein
VGGLLEAIKGAVGLGNQGQSDSEPGVGSGLDSNKMLQYTQDKWNDRKNAYVVYHQSLWQTLLFYANQSWIDWDDARKVWQPQQVTDEWVPRPRINRFSPTVDAVASNFAQIPEIEAVPKPQDDPQANMVSQVCTKLSEYIVVKESLKKQMGQALDKAGLCAQLFVLCGGMFSIIRVKNDKTNKPKLGMQDTKGTMCSNCDKYTVAQPGEEPPQFCPQCGNELVMDDTQTMGPDMGEDGQPVMEEEDNYDLSLDIGNTLWAFPRPGATSIEDSPDMLWANRRTLEDIHYRWNFEAQPDAIWPDGYSVTYEHALNFWYTGYSNTTIQVKDSCMVLEMYVPPNKVKDFPKGFYNVIINDKMAHEEEWEFPEHPLTMGEYLRLPTIFFPRSISFDLVEIQRELNAYESIIKLHAMTSAVDPIMQDISTIVSEITGRADKVIKYRKISPTSEVPSRLPSGHLDDGIYKQRDNLHSEFQNISMAVNAFRGQQEGAITAASAIQQLRSQAELMFGKPSNNWNSFWCETVRKYVKFMQFYMTEIQLNAIVGPGLEDEVKAFIGADLDKATEWVTTTHGLPKTRDERRQEMMMLFDKGALDINDPSIKSKVFELFGETGLMQTFNRDATNARLENQLFKTGAGGPGDPYKPPNIQPLPLIEDLNIHLYFHKDAAKSRDFQKWQPLAKKALISHIMATQDEIDQQEIAGMTKQLTAAAAAASVKSLSKGGPHSGAAMSASGEIQKTALDQAGDMNKNVQGQTPGLGKPTPVQGAQ